MAKIIINNQSSAPDDVAIKCVTKVMDMGFVSGEKQYCWVSAFDTSFGGLIVSARKTKGQTHSFVVLDKEQP